MTTDINKVPCRFFVHCERFYDKSYRGTVVMAADPLHPIVPGDDAGAVYFMYESKIFARISNLTPDGVLTLLVSGLWVELDKPHTEGGKRIKVYECLVDPVIGNK